MTKIATTKIFGTKSAGFANTVPMIGSSGKYGVFDQTKGEFVANTPWHVDADKVIEMFDDMTMAAVAKAAGKKAPKKTKTVAEPAAAPKIVRERNGDKAAVAKEMFETYPGMKTSKVIAYCAAKMPEVSAANWRFLINKLEGKR
jgi:hypothetical protein